MIVRVRVVLKRTVVGDWRFDNLSGSHLHNQVNSVCQSMMLYYVPLLQSYTCQFSRFFCHICRTSHSRIYYNHANSILWLSGPQMFELINTSALRLKELSFLCVRPHVRSFLDSDLFFFYFFYQLGVHDEIIKFVVKNEKIIYSRPL